VLTPLVLLYQGWSYYVFRARISGEQASLGEAAARPATGPGAA